MKGVSKMKSLFFKKVKKLSKLKTRFFMPGHKGKKQAIPEFSQIIKYDITEIQGADDLQNPTAELLQSQQNMAKLYGSGATVYSAHGGTTCVEAMITLFVNKGQKILMARNSHVSALRAACFIGAEVEWLLCDEKNNYDEDAIAEVLQKEKVAAVFVTSPNYYGFISNIPQIAEVCNKYKVALLVDNTHGAHLKFIKANCNPITLGATACADSLHKNMPCLTGAAVLHLQDEKLYNRARWAVNLYSSTSPNYLILSSIDLLVSKIYNKKIDFEKAEIAITKLKQTLSFILENPENQDVFKIVLKPKKAGYTVKQIEKLLISNKIHPEMVDEDFIVLMASPYNSAKDFAKLEKIILNYTKGEKAKTQVLEKENTENKVFDKLPEKIIEVRNAMFCETVTIETKNAEGKICGGILTVCPPGIPILMPGEKIQKNHIRQLIKKGLTQIQVIE